VSEDAITRAELEWVLKRHGSHLDAAGLMDEIEANREPAQYEPGAVYEDPGGNRWHFGRAAGDDSPFWLRPGLEGTFEFATPRRPLRRLVPADPGRGRIEVPREMTNPGSYRQVRVGKEWAEVWTGMECRYGGADPGPDFALIQLRLTPGESAIT
jgi:hypothetical protein